MHQISLQRPVPPSGQVVHLGYQRGVPTHNFPAVPVDDGREIHMTAVKFDVSNVDRPYLIWERNGFVTQ